jgi:hypothetical protein
MHDDNSNINDNKGAAYPEQPSRNARTCPECGLSLEFTPRADQGYRLTCEDRTCGFMANVDANDDEAEAIQRAFILSGERPDEYDAIYGTKDRMTVGELQEAARAARLKGDEESAREWDIFAQEREPQADAEFVRLEEQRAAIARWAKAEAIDSPEAGLMDAAIAEAAQRLTQEFADRYVTHAPRRKRPTQKQINAAMRTIGALLAWREWDAEGTREFVGSNSLDTYAGSLYDIATESNLGTDEIVDAAMDQLGLTRE